MLWVLVVPVGFITAGIDVGVVTAISFGFTSGFVVESLTSTGCLFYTLPVEAVWRGAIICWNWSSCLSNFICAPYTKVLGAVYLAQLKGSLCTGVFANT